MNVFGSTSKNLSYTLDRSSFVQKPYFRNNYVESKVEGNIDMKIQIKN